MEGFSNFVIAFLDQFFGSFLRIFKDLALNLIAMFNINSYITIFKSNSQGFNSLAWFLASLIVLLVILALAGLGFLIYYLLRRIIRARRSILNQNDLLNELANLNKEVVRLNREKGKILGLRLKQNDESFSEEIQETRFYSLKEIDKEMLEYKAPIYNNEISLEEITKAFQGFAANTLKLYYDLRLIRIFISALSSSHLIILQGISGTGKTSLPYAFGRFIKNPTQIVPVEPSWRDRSELIGYFNEFTKRYNETPLLRKMYEASYTDEIYLAVLDEMNIARVEYYFADLLSLLEMPEGDDWVIDLVPGKEKGDPQKIKNGDFIIPQNIYYIGTANNDDSTFTISDKVYDRAITINIDSKGKRLEALNYEPINISYSYLLELFKKAKLENPVDPELINKLNLLDEYLLANLHLSFGNRILKQLYEFIPVFVSAGGEALDGLDFILANKILVKLELLNLGYQKKDILNLIKYLDDLFDYDMKESKKYLKSLRGDY